MLLADDEPLSSMAMRSQLEALGHHIDAHARNGIDAVDLARCYLVDLAIIDYQMPDLTGFDAAAQIFEQRPVPVLLVSGREEPDTTYQERPPVYHYLLKPADLAALQQAIEHTLAAFQQWVHDEADPDELRRKNQEARIIQDACRILARDMNPREACRALIHHSRTTGNDLLQAARAILEDNPTPPAP